MSVVEKFRALTSRPSAAEISAELMEAERSLVLLREVHGTAALNSLSDASAQGALDTAAKNLAAGHQKISTLRAAHIAAEAAEKSDLDAKHAAAHKTLIRATKLSLTGRDKLAATLQEQLAAVADTWKKLVETSVKAERQVPGNIRWPSSAALTNLSALHSAVAHELHRLTAPASDNDRNAAPFPGAHSPSAFTRYNAAAISPLADVVAEASRYAVQVLSAAPIDKSSAPTDQPAPLPVVGSAAIPLAPRDVLPDGPKRSTAEIMPAVPKVVMTA
jgi:hypothetical protein